MNHFSRVASKSLTYVSRLFFFLIFRAWCIGDYILGKYNSHANILKTEQATLFPLYINTMFRWSFACESIPAEVLRINVRKEDTCIENAQKIAAVARNLEAEEKQNLAMFGVFARKRANIASSLSLSHPFVAVSNKARINVRELISPFCNSRFCKARAN